MSELRIKDAIISESRGATVIYNAEDGIARLKQLEESSKTGKWILRFATDNFEEGTMTMFKFVEIVHRKLAPTVKLIRSNSDKGTTCIIACVYMDDMTSQMHKRLIDYILEHDMIQRTKTGRLFNIPFKLNSQTMAGEYGKDFKAKLRLGDLVDLETGKWTYEGKEVLV